MSKRAVVYWIYHATHTDIRTQGYVGFTVQKFNTRMLNHQAYARQGKSYPVSRAIRKYGWGSLKKTVLCVGTPEYCMEIERMLRPSDSIGWNAGVGGGVAFLGRNHTEESKAKMSAAMKGKPKSEEHRRKLSAARAHVVVTDEARANMSAAGKRRVFTEQHKANISRAKKGVCSGA